ncbi:hypothetical protein PPERSA_04766 [Pseudocohnilembus persalinus]|uniref:Uncharacterized protein n=1 Tax=Pseudocohnilembus persalinus TaxID=266149 RepID=A0A0V0QPF1_PSEPJ|nr:hypothetical protein PPERSA_04766 [Pseudocohnilembus persalinus]|eukprot:KRX03888.1 hypothetical protein PPERSA_04766 [Pseudocohnilembus persalinus]
MFSTKPSHQFDIKQQMNEKNPYQTQIQLQQQNKQQLLNARKTVSLLDQCQQINSSNPLIQIKNEQNNYLEKEKKNIDLMQKNNFDQQNKPLKKISQSLRISVSSMEQRRPLLNQGSGKNQVMQRNIGTSHSKFSMRSRKSKRNSVSTLNQQSSIQLQSNLNQEKLMDQSKIQNKNWKHFNHVYQTFETQLHDNIYIKLDKRPKKIDNHFKPTKTKLGYFSNFNENFKQVVKNPMEVEFKPYDFQDLKFDDDKL